MVEKEEPTLIAAQIKKARLAAKLTQAEVANLLKLNRIALVNLENGKRAVTADELLHLAKVFRVNPLFLLGRSQITFDPDDPDLQSTRRPKDLTFHHHFLVLDFLFLSTLLNFEKNHAEIIEAFASMHVLAPPLSVVRSRLRFLAQQRCLTRRFDSATRRMYYCLTEKGMAQFHEMCALVKYLSRIGDIAMTHLPAGV